ncbi:class I SAM-dependent methyltransferase [Bacillus sp. CECT 9360]|uniref:class I SAM-dependent methyltransferase n=1 Tax=Bacillus sp. CECT 9360 TaxID=2845821 RepID=UPI001E51401E|nr:class I SAM-dependent methyltransferase [Bacillus sp. CECT 9360]CAH0344937.1 2-methoxy-6-polyprenyl-1,4-benzoquinol methylase, mitochondrial [Bacillus sp. CECT 9360]
MSVSYQDALAHYGIDGAHPGGIALTKKILENEKITRHSKVLDAGCGTGQTSAYLTKTFSCDVFSIDKHPAMFKAATERFKDENLSIKALKGDLENLPFPKDSFDFIIAESSTSFATIPKALSEYCRVLKPSGVLLNIDMTAEQKLNSDEKKELMEFYKMQDILTEKQWIKTIKNAGFKTVEALHSNTVLQELEEYPVEEKDYANTVNPKNFDRKMDDAIQNHHRLLISYREKLGYRVYKAKKMDFLSYPS